MTGNAICSSTHTVTVPAQVWGNRVSVGQSFFVPLIRSAAVSAHVFAPPDSLGGARL